MKLDKELVIYPALALVVTFYFWTALTNGDGPPTHTKPYYDQLADSFLEGHFYLDGQPAPELLALPDPYDPKLNAPFRLHDASLYHGKYYLYFGATPAVLLFTPYLFLTGRDLPQEIAVSLFCSAGFIFSSSLFLLLLRNHCPAVPLWLRLACIFSLGMANTCPFLIRRPEVFEVAISCAYALLQLAFLAFYLSLRKPRQTLLWLGLTSACLGASVGARPNYSLIVVVFIAALFWLWRQKLYRPEIRLRQLFFVLAPMGFIGLMLAWYNYARFADPFEFGQSYQLSAVPMQRTEFIRLSNVPYNLWFYFLAPPYLSSTFPFIRAEPFVWFSRPDYYFSLENVAGLLLISPVSIFAFALPLVLRAKINSVDQPLSVTLVFMATSALAALLPILCVSGATMRYFVDFAPTLIFLGGIVICHLHASLNPKTRASGWGLSALCALILFLGCWNGLLLSFTGYYDSLHKYRPEIYDEVQQLFRPVEVVAKFAANLFHR